MKILLTGASGFLGSALTLHFLNANHDVALLLRPSSALDRLRDLGKACEIGRCVTDSEVNVFIRRIQPEVVIHTACVYGRQGETMPQIADTNLRFGLLILQALLSLDRPATFVNTGTSLMPEISLYALSKTQFTQWGRFMCKQSKGKLRFINVLLQHIYGPGDNPSKFTTHVLHVCHENEPTLKLTLGEQRRDFIYIDDVVSAYSTLLYQINQLEPWVDIELGSGVAPTIREFVETIRRLTMSRTQLVFGALPYRDNEVMFSQANIEQMKKLGWKPRYDLESGLKKTIKMEFSE